MAIRPLTIGFLAAATLAALPMLSFADSVIVSSLSLPIDPTGPAIYKGIGLEDMQLFVTDNHRYQLTSVIARVGNQSGTPNVFSELRADDTGNNLPVVGVSNVLATFAIPDLTGVVSDRAFNPNAPVVLEPNTRYWFGVGTLSGPEAGQFNWAFSSASGPVTGPGAIPSRFAETFDAGNSWEGFTATPFFLEVRGDIIATGAAPEPSSFGLLAFAGLPGIALIARRRRN